MFKGLKSLLAGIAAGTALGVIFAPEKGKKLREKFEKEFKEGGNGLKTTKAALSEIGKDISETDTYKKAEASVRKQAKEVKKNLPAKARKQIKEGIKKAKKTVKKVLKKK